MAHPYHHALSSVRRWGGQVEDYLPIHAWFDESKAMLADFRHRALRHHAEGIFLSERIFGVTITNSNGRKIPVRWIGEQHVKEDLGRIPTAADWLMCIAPARWMMNNAVRLSKESPDRHDNGATEAMEGSAQTTCVAHMAAGATTPVQGRCRPRASVPMVDSA